MERLKLELGRYPRIEDLFYMAFKISVEASQLEKLELGVKIDPKAHDIYEHKNSAKGLISVPLDIDQSLNDLKKALESSFYTSRLLTHSRRLLTLFLLGETNQKGFFNIENSFMKSFDQNIDSFDMLNEPNQKFNTKKNNQEEFSDFFHSNPINYTNKTFENEGEIFIKENLKISIDTVVESYNKTIGK
jgi:hypothetical protein